MKKIIAIMIMIAYCSLLLAGCENANSLYAIKINDKTITYNTTKSDIENILGNGEKIKSIYPDMVEYNKSIKISYSNNKARYIEVNDPSITTFNEIKVGDNIANVLKKYKYETKSGNNYLVTFSKENEININENKLVDFWITYSTNNDKVSKIVIYDNIFAKELK